MAEALRHTAVSFTELAFSFGRHSSETGAYSKSCRFWSCGSKAVRTIRRNEWAMAYERFRVGTKKGRRRLDGCTELRVTTVGSARTKKIFFGPNVVKGMYQMEEDMSGVSEISETNLNGGQEIGSPPWGNLKAHQCLDLELGSAKEVLNLSSKIVLAENDRVLFLEERDERVLSFRLLSLSRSNKVRSAMELLRSMKLCGLLPSVHACNSFISCLLRNGLLSDALNLFEFMKMRGVASGYSCSLIIKAVSTFHGFEAAMKMFWKMERECDITKEFDIVVYNTVISACARVDNWVQAAKIWNLMKDNGQNGTEITYSLLVCTFVRCEQTEMAIDAYNEMVKYSFEPGKDAMQAIIGACSKEGKWDMALAVFQKMVDNKLTPSLVTCNALINMLGKAGFLKEAFHVYGIMKSLGRVPDAFTCKALLGALYQADRYADALQFFESLREENSSLLNVHLYNSALMACQKLRLWEKALQLLWQMEASELSVETTSYNIVISTCEGARKPKVALQVYDHMLQQSRHPNTFTYLSLIRGCIWGSLWVEVEEIINMIPPNSSLYNAAIQGMSLRGKSHEARKLYKEMLSYDLKPDGKTRAFMLQTYKKLPQQHKKLAFMKR